MTLEIDALGKACPMPVVLAKQALDQCSCTVRKQATENKR